MTFGRGNPVLLSVLFACTLAGPAASQQLLENPLSTFPHPFGSLRSVRELQDGRLLVPDLSEGDLFLVDLANGSTEKVGGQGSGPQEYQGPDAVWPLAGDSTLLVDIGNGRLTVIAPNLAFTRTVRIHQAGGPMQPTPLVLALPTGVDGYGRIYSMQRGENPGGPAGYLTRFPAEGGAPDTVTTLQLQEYRTEGGGGMMRLQPVPLSPHDAWGVGSDGSVVVARAEDFHLEWIEPDGTTRLGAPIAYEPVPVGEDEREALLAVASRSPGGLSIQAGMINGALTLIFARNPTGGSLPSDPTAWPDVHPPFFGGHILLDKDGRAWLRRHVPAGAPTTYDVFDAPDVRVGTVLLDPQKTIIGFGQRGIYVAAPHSAGGSFLELYQAPVF